MTEKRFELRNPKIDYTIQCEEISDNKNWITYGEIVDLLNYLLEENEQLKKSVKRQQSSNNECGKLIEEQQKENERLKKELDYYKNKCASLETGLIQVEKTNLKLQEENQILRKNLSDKDIEWIREHTVWEQMPNNRRTITKTSDHMGWKSK